MCLYASISTVHKDRAERPEGRDDDKRPAARAGGVCLQIDGGGVQLSAARLARVK